MKLCLMGIHKYKDTVINALQLPSGYCYLIISERRCINCSREVEKMYYCNLFMSSASFLVYEEVIKK